MSNAAKLKRRAAELEQKKQFDKALPLYVQFLQESESLIDDADIPLYNRVGDLMLRTGSASDALGFYEKAVDLYAERGFLNNAIALCNKVLRQSPGRASIYYKLGKISATKGFKNDAKKNFLEYADRMQKAGRIDEAFRALKEFADLCPDQDDIRLLLADQLSKENRQEEALEQLQKLHDRLDSEGRAAEARATAERMKAIDPEVVPRTSGSYPQQKSSDLIFLDTSFDEPTRSAPSRAATPPSPLARGTPAPGTSAPIPATPTPTTQRVSDPDLVVLTLADQSDLSVTPVDRSAGSGAFEFELTEMAEAEPSPGSGELPMLEIEAGTRADAAPSDAAPSDPEASDAGVVDLDTLDLETTGTSDAVQRDGTPAVIQRLDIDLEEVASRAEPALEVVQDQPFDPGAIAAAETSNPPLGIDYAGDLAADVLDIAPDHAGLFDFRAPPKAEGDELPSPESLQLDPDVAFPAFDLGEDLPSADEITSGASLAAALGYEEMTGTIDDVAEVLDDASLDWPSSAEPAPPAASETAAHVLSDDQRAVEPTESEPAASPAADGASSVDDSATDSPETDSERTAAEATPPDVMPAVVVTPIAEPRETEVAAAAAITWQEKRANAERLLEGGDRDGGLLALDEVAASLERLGDLERALTIIDELLRLSPDAIGHHQKRVELAFRLNDRPKLIDAYLELGDALFRAGEERKARAVYNRVHELAPDDPRARAAVESVASMSGAASGAMAAIADHSAGGSRITPATPTSDRPAAESVARQAPPPPSTHARSNGAGASSAKRPAPLDRAAANGDFVDLGEWLRDGESPRSTRMVTEEKPPSGDEQADFEEMLKRFKQGVAENVDEEDYESHYDLGVAYKEMGLMDEAVAEFQKALRASTNRVRAYEALGQCFVEKEQYQVAASVLTRAMALGEGDDHHLVGVLYLLGRATEALSNSRGALDYYQRVFAVDIGFRDVADRISAIERKAT